MLVTWLLVISWQSLAFLGLQRHHLVSAFIVTLHSPCVHVCVHMSPFHNTSHTAVGPTLLQYDLILTNYICNDPIPK